MSLFGFGKKKEVSASSAHAHQTFPEIGWTIDQCFERYPNLEQRPVTKLSEDFTLSDAVRKSLAKSEARVKSSFRTDESLLGLPGYIYLTFGHDDTLTDYTWTKDEGDGTSVDVVNQGVKLLEAKFGPMTPEHDEEFPEDYEWKAKGEKVSAYVSATVDESELSLYKVVDLSLSIRLNEE